MDHWTIYIFPKVKFLILDHSAHLIELNQKWSAAERKMVKEEIGTDEPALEFASFEEAIAFAVKICQVSRKEMWTYYVVPSND